MNLDDLISQVQESAITDEPLDRLAAAMGVKADLDDVTDSLIGHFVDQARRAGCSWSEIGSAMGVTKQAAQQRHTSERPRRDRPFRVGRFTPRAKNVMREAHAAATELGHDELRTEHVLLGILAVPRCLAAEALASLGFAEDKVLAAVPGDKDRPRQRRRHLPIAPLTKQALEQAVEQARRLGHNYIGTEHLLLALLALPDGLAATVLVEAGVTSAAVEAFVVERLKKVS